jgi:hypothetical protein
MALTTEALPPAITHFKRAVPVNLTLFLHPLDFATTKHFCCFFFALCGSFAFFMSFFVVFSFMCSTSMFFFFFFAFVCVVAKQ